ncbi:MAG: hypothetical protein KatS3mg104_2963 [Phycisphaerae bacterium]|nr:MAG: hypothetical protein KatS3mg104_2963 [Phycisphaerae bacterium]
MVPSFTRSLASLADQASRIVESWNINGVSADLADLTDESNVTGDADRIITKAELLDGITLMASIAFYLRNLTGSLPTLTALETPPLSASDLRQYVNKLSYI